MITYGIVLLIIGIIIWAVAHAAGVPPVVGVLGQALAAIGVVLLIVGVVLLVVRGGGLHTELDAMRILVGL